METSKVIEFFEKAERIALLIPSSPNLDVLVSAEIISSILASRGKIVGLLSPLKKESLDKELFPQLMRSHSLPKEFIVSLNTSLAPISQMRYDKGENSLDVIFTPKLSAITRESVSFKEGRISADAVVTCGIESIESLNGSLDVAPEFFTETPILNIDISPKNSNFGEVNFILPEKTAIAEAIYELVTSLTETPLEKDAATLVLGALLEKTEGFQSSHTQADTFLLASELMRLGADFARARALRGTKPLALTQLMGRAAVRSRLDDKKGVLWSFVTAEDFEKTGRTPDDIPALLEHIEKEFPPHQLSALVWQDKAASTIRATLYGDHTKLAELETAGSGTFQSPYLLINSTFATFREAEDKINSLLATIL